MVAKRSLFKFQDRPEDFNLFAIDEDDDDDYYDDDDSSTTAITTKYRCNSSFSK
jgi:hypothetical protein